MLDGEAVAGAEARYGPPVRLSVCTVTGAGPEHLGPWLTALLDVADELVVTLDRRAPAQSVELARRLADHVARAELRGTANPAYGWTATRATGDWVLVLDDDERLASGFRDRLPALMADQRFSHYHLPMRWVVRADGELRWVRQFPWWPNRATRLFRNVGGLARHAPAAHSSWEVFGEGSALEDEDVVVYHLDLALRDRAAREAKVAAHYRRDEPGAASCEEYYLYEDYRETLELEPVPRTVADPVPTERARARAAARAARAERPAVVEVSHDELLAHWASVSDEPARP